MTTTSGYGDGTSAYGDGTEYGTLSTDYDATTYGDTDYGTASQGNASTDYATPTGGSQTYANTSQGYGTATAAYDTSAGGANTQTYVATSGGYATTSGGGSQTYGATTDGYATTSGGGSQTYGGTTDGYGTTSGGGSQTYAATTDGYGTTSGGGSQTYGATTDGYGTTSGGGSQTYGAGSTSGGGSQAYGAGSTSGGGSSGDAGRDADMATSGQGKKGKGKGKGKKGKGKSQFASQFNQLAGDVSSEATTRSKETNRYLAASAASHAMSSMSASNIPTTSYTSFLPPPDYGRLDSGSHASGGASRQPTGNFGTRSFGAGTYTAPGSTAPSSNKYGGGARSFGNSDGGTATVRSRFDESARSFGASVGGATSNRYDSGGTSFGGIGSSGGGGGSNAQRGFGYGGGGGVTASAPSEAYSSSRNRTQNNTLTTSAASRSWGYRSGPHSDVSNSRTTLGGRNVGKKRVNESLLSTDDRVKYLTSNMAYGIGIPGNVHDDIMARYRSVPGEPHSNKPRRMSGGSGQRERRARDDSVLGSTSGAVGFMNALRRMSVASFLWGRPQEATKVNGLDLPIRKRLNAPDAACGCENGTKYPDVQRFGGYRDPTAELREKDHDDHRTRAGVREPIRGADGSLTNLSGSPNVHTRGETGGSPQHGFDRSPRYGDSYGRGSMYSYGKGSMYSYDEGSEYGYGENECCWWCGRYPFPCCCFDCCHCCCDACLLPAQREYVELEDDDDMYSYQTA